jgi:hypothetical protein
MNAIEHIAWAKERAVRYLDEGNPADAFASIVSDLQKHPETEQLASLALFTSNPATIAEWIDGLAGETKA